MKNRIEINGVWYIKETNSTPTLTPKLEPSVSFEGLVFESDLYCFEATRLRDDEGTAAMSAQSLNFSIVFIS